MPPHQTAMTEGGVGGGVGDGGVLQKIIFDHVTFIKV